MRINSLTQTGKKGLIAITIIVIPYICYRTFFQTTSNSNILDDILLESFKRPAFMEQEKGGCVSSGLGINYCSNIGDVDSLDRDFHSYYKKLFNEIRKNEIQRNIGFATEHNDTINMLWNNSLRQAYRKGLLLLRNISEHGDKYKALKIEDGWMHLSGLADVAMNNIQVGKVHFSIRFREPIVPNMININIKDFNDISVCLSLHDLAIETDRILSEIAEDLVVYNKNELLRVASEIDNLTDTRQIPSQDRNNSLNELIEFAKQKDDRKKIITRTADIFYSEKDGSYYNDAADAINSLIADFVRLRIAYNYYMRSKIEDVFSESHPVLSGPYHEPLSVSPSGVLKINKEYLDKIDKKHLEVLMRHESFHHLLNIPIDSIESVIRKNIERIGWFLYKHEPELYHNMQNIVSSINVDSGKLLELYYLNQLTEIIVDLFVMDSFRDDEIARLAYLKNISNQTAGFSGTDNGFSKAFVNHRVGMVEVLNDMINGGLDLDKIILAYAALEGLVQWEAVGVTDQHYKNMVARYICHFKKSLSYENLEKGEIFMEDIIPETPPHVKDDVYSFSQLAERIMESQTCDTK